MEALILHDNKRGLEIAVKILKKSGILIYPTETSYGIGCDATDKKAVKKIYAIKKRSGKKPLSVIFGSLPIAKKYVFLNKTAVKLANNFMPGPLTLVSKPKKRLIASPKNEIAFRIPSGLFSLRLAKKFKKPITATSANISGKKPVYDFKKAYKLFHNKAGAIIDNGALPKRKVSTIFNTITAEIIRKGAISENKIKKCLLHG